MHRLASLGVGARLAAGILFAMACVLWIAFRDLGAIESMMMEEKRAATRSLVETAHGVVAHYAGLADAGKLTVEEARKAAVAALRGLRYAGKEYFWVNDMQPRMVMHPIKPELDGQDLAEQKDPSGKRLFVAFVDEVKAKNAGFVEYLWPKPGASEPVPKLSYVKGFAPWGWVIGSGIYVDDVQAAVAAHRRTEAAWIAGIMAIMVVGGLLLRRSIVRPIAASARLAQSIAGGDLDNAIAIEGPQESRRMLAALADMQRGLRERIAADRARLDENERIRQALDASSVPVRIVDNAGTILFMNRTLRRKIDTLEPEIRKRIPAFDKAKLLGGSIGIFYPNPQEALERLRTITAERRSALEIGGRHFDIVTNPIVNDAGERLGTVGEWVDRHDELRAERRLAELIDAAGRGDFSGRVDLDGLAGFHLSAAEGINRLMDAVAQSLAALAEVLAGLSRGELHQRMDGTYHGLFAKLQGDMNGTVEQLATTVGEIREAADSVGVAAREIAQGNTDLSSRTEEQASSLQETASSMEQLTSTVKQTAEHAREANRLAGDASQLAAAGGATVTQVVATMAAIGESSRRVQEIIAVIDGIAFQTNILALNAAVEAARAGEQGKGFAVVATEVRTLAQRSAAAAREIRELIANAASRVEAGSTLVQTAGSQMNDIVGAVKRVTDIIGEIASAAGEQSAGIDQVNTAVSQMDQMTQQNAALVEEAAAAAESLQEQAGNLAAAIGAFKLARATPAARRLAQAA